MNERQEANLVLHSNRRRRRTDEPSGEAQSLASGGLTRMGDRVRFERPTELVDRLKKKQRKAAREATRCSRV